MSAPSCFYITRTGTCITNPITVCIWRHGTAQVGKAEEYSWTDIVCSIFISGNNNSRRFPVKVVLSGFRISFHVSSIQSLNYHLRHRREYPKPSGGSYNKNATSFYFFEDRGPFIPSPSSEETPKATLRSTTLTFSLQHQVLKDSHCFVNKSTSVRYLRWFFQSAVQKKVPSSP